MHLNYNNDVIGMIYCDADAIIHLKLCACVAFVGDDATTWSTQPSPLSSS